MSNNTNVSITLISGQTNITKAVASISRRGKKLDHDIWVAGASAVAHAKEHGDLSLFGALVQAMPKGSRVSTLIQWASMAAPIAVRNGKVSVDKTRVGDMKEFEADRSDWDIDFLIESPWFDHKQAKSATEITRDTLIKILTTYAEGEDTDSKTYSEDVVALATKLLATANETPVKGSGKADKAEMAKAA